MTRRAWPPGYRRGFTARARCRRKTAGTVAMDPTDSEILRLLREDGRSPGATSAPPSASAPTPPPTAYAACARAGVITGFVALSTPPPAAATSRRSSASRSRRARLRRVRRSPPPGSSRSSRCCTSRGAPDYQLRVACRDTAELDALLRTLRNRARRRRHRDDDRAALGSAGRGATPPGVDAAEQGRSPARQASPTARRSARRALRAPPMHSARGLRDSSLTPRGPPRRSPRRAGGP